MKQQELNVQLEQYLLGKLTPNVLDKLKKSVTSNPDFSQQWLMTQQLMPYIDGELSAEKVAEFEQYLTQNDFLKAQVKTFQQTVGGIQQYGKDDLRKYLTRFDKELDEELLLNEADYEAAFEDEDLHLTQIPFEIDEDGDFIFLPKASNEAKPSVAKVVKMSPIGTSKPSSKSTFSWKPIYNIAAILLVLLIPVYLFFNPSLSDSQKVAYEFYEKLNITETNSELALENPIQTPAHASGEPIDAKVGEQNKNNQEEVVIDIATKNSTTATKKTKKQKPFYADFDEKADDLVSILSKAHTAYDNNQFEEAAPLFEKIAKDLVTGKEQTNAKLYAASAWLGAKKPQKAIPIFKEVALQNTTVFDPSQIQWNLALAYLQMNQNEEAKIILKQLATKANYTSKVNHILSKINE